jgi:hypothetical protein
MFCHCDGETNNQAFPGARRLRKKSQQYNALDKKSIFD